MTDIKIGSKWVSKTFSNEFIEVVGTYNDPEDGLVIHYKRKGLYLGSSRNYYCSCTEYFFLGYFQPRPKKKIQRWVNLYSDGIGYDYPSHQEAKDSAVPMRGGEYIETRLIEWFIDQD